MPLVSFLILSCFMVISIMPVNACTIGISTDSEGNAMLWKNRDKSLSTTLTSQLLYVVEEDIIEYISVATSGSDASYMGLNKNGFAIANSLVLSDSNLEEDLSLRSDEYELIEQSLKTCSSVADFGTLVSTLNPTYDSTDHIISNFAVIDSNGNGRLYEINTYNEQVQIDFVELSSTNPFIIRSNHFVLLSNPTEGSLNQLDNYNCNENDIVTEDLISNKMRYCSSEQLLYNLSTVEIGKLISTNNLYGNAYGKSILRSLSKSRITSGDVNFYDDYQSYFFQSKYDCAKGFPAGYIFTKYSIARAQTVSSIIIKSIKNNADYSFMLAALGNPLITPYVPFWVDAIPANFNGSDISLKADTLRKLIFDYEYPVDSISVYNRWIDSQHLIPSEGGDNPGPNHSGIFLELNDIESSYYDWGADIITGITMASLPAEKLDLTQSIYNSSINYFNDYIHGFNQGNYDSPLYYIRYQKNENDIICFEGFCSYEGMRIIDRTFHRKHTDTNYWEIADNMGNIIFSQNNADYINPLISKSDWNEIDDEVNISLKINNTITIVAEDNRTLACTNENALNYDVSSNNVPKKIDNESCIFCTAGDMNGDEIWNVLDVITQVNCILAQNCDDALTYEFGCAADMNGDGIFNVLDVVILINTILDI